MAPNHNPPSNFFIILLIIITSSLSLLPLSTSDTSQEAQTLHRFKNFLSNNAIFTTWNTSTSICNWSGILCKSNNSFLYGIRLENLTLTGTIDIESLTGLRTLRSLSFKNNSFNGPMPDVKRLSSLKVLYLSYNKFSGEIGDGAFGGMNSLRYVHLEENEFSGNIPRSLADLPVLVELNLERNGFGGGIPGFLKRDWKVLNFSDNQLVGPIPDGVANVDASSFLHNKGLCGKPLAPCTKPTKDLTKWYIGIGLAVGITSILIIFIIRRRQGPLSKPGSLKDPNAHKNNMGLKEAQSPDYAEISKKGSDANLCFVRNIGKERFDLQDLLRASAVVLGSGSVGSTYKASLLNGPTVAVKRFKKMNNAGREEFHEHMKRLGGLSHPNLLPLLAFYYRKEDKLLVSEFVENGSLATHLHARRAAGQPGLDWPSRMKIIKGVARGLSHLHNQLPKLTIPHGHLKSSNVLLTRDFTPILTDYALVPIINKDHAHQFIAAYKSPEFTQTNRASKKTDVWSLGILILETLTGRFPANYLRQSAGKGTTSDDLGAWVTSVVREEWTGEVFDSEMKGIRNGDDTEMLKLLKIGMCCCEWDVEKRWELVEAVEKIEELKEMRSERNGNEGDDDFYSSYGTGSDGDAYSGRGMSAGDENSFLG